MKIQRISLAVLLCITAFTTPSIGFVSEQCNTIDGAKVCVEDLSTSKDILLTGEQASLSVKVKNTGSKPATILITLNTAGPNNTTSVYPLGGATLMPGENKTITQSLNGSNPGVHGFRVLVTEEKSNKKFDTSGIVTIEVRDEPPMRLGGPIDRTEIALVALFLSFTGIVGLGYRQYT